MIGSGGVARFAGVKAFVNEYDQMLLIIVYPASLLPHSDSMKK